MSSQRLIAVEDENRLSPLIRTCTWNKRYILHPSLSVLALTLCSCLKKEKNINLRWLIVWRNFLFPFKYRNSVLVLRLWNMHRRLMCNRTEAISSCGIGQSHEIGSACFKVCETLSWLAAWVMYLPLPAGLHCVSTAEHTVLGHSVWITKEMEDLLLGRAVISHWALSLVTWSVLFGWMQLLCWERSTV